MYYSQLIDPMILGKIQLTHMYYMYRQADIISE